MPKISVIVPVYKAELYLTQCVDSILAQTFRDFELILVDDGSPDSCGTICNEYSIQDGRVRVIHQANQGQAAARNHGIAVARGEWICFVDSDDLIHPQMLEHLYYAAINGDVDISACSAVESVDVLCSFAKERNANFQTVSMDENGLIWAKKDGEYVYWTIWGKLIRKKIVEKFPFTNNRIYEDNAVVCRWLFEAGKIAYSPSEYYFYRINETGTTKSVFSLKKLDLLWALEEQIRFYDSVGYQNMKKEICAYYLKTAAWYSSRVRNELNNYRAAANVREQMRRMIQDNPLNTLHLTEAEREMIERAFHPLREQLRRLPRVVKETIQSGGILALLRRALRKLKHY